MNTNQCIDPDGNVIRQGMGVVHQGLVWRVQHAHRNHLTLVHVRTPFNWVRRVTRQEFRTVHVIGFQLPNPWPSGIDPTELALHA